MNSHVMIHFRGALDGVTVEIEEVGKGIFSIVRRYPSGPSEKQTWSPPPGTTFEEIVDLYTVNQKELDRIEPVKDAIQVLREVGQIEASESFQSRVVAALKKGGGR